MCKKHGKNGGGKKHGDVSKRARNEIKGGGKNNQQKWKVQEFWTKKTGKKFADWVCEQNAKGEDDAYRFFYNKCAPYQCPDCVKLNHHTYSDDMTNLVFPLCQKCRFNGIKLMNMHYYGFIHGYEEAGKKSKGKNKYQSKNKHKKVKKVETESEDEGDSGIGESDGSDDDDE